MKIEINMKKKHFWALAGLIVLLFGVTFVIAKTTTPAWTTDKPFHDLLYADVIAGKTANKVVVDDDLEVTGIIRGEFAFDDCVWTEWDVYCEYSASAGFDVAKIRGIECPGNKAIVAMEARWIDTWFPQLPSESGKECRIHDGSFDLSVPEFHASRRYYCCG
ncbi:hypothetical protein COV19_04625 [Candidatus Woesearchaeota archaeon CG10_big_fil_rev_8_21_14_0_10_44_13]|nr:MAG: hypothetical protein COV19_04625 [Candidatus Woesearchaeota archaeon CG10_big_fil_rev_8_21_14_0_10_44_13]